MKYFVLIFACLFSSVTLASSTRVEVYPVSQSYWDVVPGETLGMIVKQLLPNNPGMRKRLMNEILELNPDAFSSSNPDNLKANVRLWLPNHTRAMKNPIDKQKYQIQEFSWGYVQRLK
ncbi:MAG: hypothetical protein OQL06_06525 [Gammaproteobacteria bacterium]|nr:hypothetical protein [Gammaproteobacteria bacterium]